jgi:hypothetical protein
LGTTLGVIRLKADAKVDFIAGVLNFATLADVVASGTLYLLFNEILRVTQRDSVEALGEVTVTPRVLSH